ncbi:MAG: helix-turn-helix domain-containing protein [Opitutae bacterium]|nr:helix-turn-helix domain-containing protein [Opitutae bacterium]
MLQNLTKKNQAVANTIAKEALDLLVDYNWPGNVRELENIVHRSAVLAQGNTILAKDLPSEINQAEYSDITASTKEKGENEAVDFHDLYNELCQISDNQDILSRVEAELIKEAIGASKGVLAKAAKILGMTTNTLKKRIEKYQIQ